MLCFVGSVLFSLLYQECSNSGGCLVLLPGLARRPGLPGAPGCPQPLQLLAAWPSLGMKTHEVFCMSNMRRALILPVEACRLMAEGMLVPCLGAGGTGCC